MKKFLFCFCLCCALLVGMAFPAFAVEVSDLPNQYLFDIEFTMEGFQSVSNGSVTVLSYKKQIDLSGKMVSSMGDFVDVTFSGLYGSSSSGAYSGTFRTDFKAYKIPPVYHGLGNPALAFLGEDNGMNFFIAYYVESPQYSELYVSPDFYNDLFVNPESGPITHPGYRITVNAVTGDNATASITDGLTGVLGFAGDIVSALVSPDGSLSGILPVVGLSVGLAIVVWGIRKFKYCTWGF